MTPGARVQAAIEVLDRVFAGAAAERALTGWARGARYAGSKDRAAVRDHVFDALRRLRSAAWLGGLGDRPFAALDGRAVMAGLLIGRGEDPATLFTGEGHAPARWDAAAPDGPMPEAVAQDCPDWLLPRFRASLGEDAAPVLAHLRNRAPVVLRANRLRITRDALAERLAAEGVETAPHALAPDALEVTGSARGLTGGVAFAEGLFEMQDAGSQALVAQLPHMTGAHVLDLCAGGGGKSLALAARGARVTAHDADRARMRDIPARAARAGASIEMVDDPSAAAPFDAIVCDVPCSGSGSWRRAPEAKWRLDPDRLAELTRTQDAILDRAVSLLRPGGWIAYMTCSLLREENDARADAALARHGLRLERRWACTPLDGADGFHLSILRDKAA
ncbi:RsmB/NOP family class I SAM-dependent RNA methyltransferase [Jannaschia seohaensis]|uniref:16S rRNA (Cytosine967-C5)-methyltransferase n=1 Tax=Jannaschia seohaensis TaxID=475081 RepID=A0A2Y9AUC7_9RHOB|nr:RsmB/NOP family class I SAM-dependent RNA methyltransferase [Jannaschia seohaensis]PWJ19187.1 16S rRNA (cytosine967-C5)-methyltransferase [Jannaschia seohaensis]SSA45849.1 16S rRNA (cytosine967-C5)-methyltransferase [Jannaschia seohaensis]